jgi:hypothetical protein
MNGYGSRSGKSSASICGGGGDITSTCDPPGLASHWKTYLRPSAMACLRLMMVGVSAAMALPPSAIGVVVRPSSMGSTYIGGGRS